MNTCEEGHAPIAFSQKDCPLCDVKEELEELKQAICNWKSDSKQMVADFAAISENAP